jgi:hypothetical protein
LKEEVVRRNLRFFLYNTILKEEVVRRNLRFFLYNTI